MKTAFIGHRQIFADNVGERLTDAILSEVKNGCREFTMGTHGDFDTLALDACRRLRRTYPEIRIEAVITSLNTIKKEDASSPYADVNTVMFEIENAYYKRQIILSNRRMIDSCDTLICYVDAAAYRSGAKAALRYAQRRGLKIVNLYEK